jgi:uncharacterized protein (TIGR03083 family)
MVNKKAQHREPDFISVLAREGKLLAEISADVGLTSPVPCCPGWSVKDLVVHLGGAYLSVLELLRGGAWRTSDHHRVHGHPIDWLLAGLTELCATLEQLPVDTPVPTFWPEIRGPKIYWARRQAHETAVHRVDVELVRGQWSGFAVEFARDGIDELLTGMLTLSGWTDSVRSDFSLGLLSTDGDDWLVHLRGGRLHARKCTGRIDADAIVRGTASEIYRWLWNRGDQVAIEGDRAAALAWREVRIQESPSD